MKSLLTAVAVHELESSVYYSTDFLSGKQFLREVKSIEIVAITI